MGSPLALVVALALALALALGAAADPNPALREYPGCPAWSKPASAVTAVDTTTCEDVALDNGVVTVNGTAVDCWCIVYDPATDSGALQDCQINGLVPIAMSGSCGPFVPPDNDFVCAAEVPNPHSALVVQGMPYQKTYTCDDPTAVGIKVEFSALLNTARFGLSIAPHGSALDTENYYNANGYTCVVVGTFGVSPNMNIFSRGYYAPSNNVTITIECHTSICNVISTGDYTPTCRSDFFLRCRPWDTSMCRTTSWAERFCSCVVLEDGYYKDVDFRLCSAVDHRPHAESIECDNFYEWQHVRIPCESTGPGTCQQGSGYRCSTPLSSESRPDQCFGTAPGPDTLEPCNACNYKYSRSVGPCMNGTSEVTFACVDNAGAAVDTFNCDGPAPASDSVACGSTDPTDGPSSDGGGHDMLVAVGVSVAAVAGVAVAICFWYKRRQPAKGDRYVPLDPSAARLGTFRARQ